MADKIIIREQRNREHALNRIAALKIDPEKPMEVTIKPYKKNRSLEQNALYWKWLSIMGADLGYSKDEMHEAMMRKHLTPDLINTPSGIIEVYTTKNKPVKVMAAYLTAIEITAGQLGIALPHPDDQGRNST